METEIAGAAVELQKTVPPVVAVAAAVVAAVAAAAVAAAVAAAAGPVAFGAVAAWGTADAAWGTVLRSALDSQPNLLGMEVW